MFSDRVRRRLEDIVGDAARAQQFLADMDLTAFERDDRTMLAIERLLQRVTEATIHIGAADMARIGSDIPVAKLRAFGNLLRHQYAEVDAGVVYTIATRDLPVLAAAAARALASE